MVQLTHSPRLGKFLKKKKTLVLLDKKIRVALSSLKLLFNFDLKANEVK